jgi:hypothetical protein
LRRLSQKPRIFDRKLLVVVRDSYALSAALPVSGTEVVFDGKSVDTKINGGSELDPNRKQLDSRRTRAGEIYALNSTRSHEGVQIRWSG